MWHNVERKMVMTRDLDKDAGLASPKNSEPVVSTYTDYTVAVVEGRHIVTCADNTTFQCGSAEDIATTLAALGK
jgi:hypothetical protein